MCYRNRTEAKDLPVQWEWRANPDQWIPYDLASASELEDAYQQNKPVCKPAKGYFSAISYRYEVHFNYATRRFVQYNLSTGGTRRVRRMANDDNSILQPVAFSELNQDDTCAICLDTFADPSTTAADQHAAKLPACHGHYFHRCCVAAVIKLRDECPMCKKKVEY
ncbi:8597_t:CDS:2 [Paraglomus occultum]|uniref:8597_t:CDS:1 n=1 Tax=Paraglomus occultum TaxID=144539 RepID=A0A9N9AXA1_9GLOM|nr:8597_t:CDS:2 [Paraglomus occultum]